MRYILAMTAAFALLLSFVQAPLAHVHFSGPDHGHAAAMPHTHLRLLSDRHLALQGPDDDDDVQSIDWVLLAKDTSQHFAFAIVVPAIAPSPAVRYELPRTPAPRAHDPPGLIKLPPRAPPV